MASPARNPMHARRQARRHAVQALYQWQLSDSSMADIEAQFRALQDMRKADVDYFHELLHNIAQQAAALETQLISVLDRKLEHIDPVERSVLLIGAYELQSRLDIPFRVVINEAADLAKRFGAPESFALINHVLDQLAKTLRRTEREASPLT